MVQNQHINLIILLIVITIALGAYVKHRSFGLACDWLSCRDSWLPSTEAQFMQSLHRLFAFIAAVYVAVFAATALVKANRGIARLRKRLIAIAAIAIMQLLVGALTVVTDLNVAWAVIHLTIATALFAALAELKFRLCSGR